MIYKLLLTAVCIGYSATAMPTVFIEMNFENGKVPYVGSGNKHPGGGYISFLGGEVKNGVNPGDGTQEYSKYTNVILDSSPDAKNSTNGSNYSLKTQYKVGHERSFQRNTTIIKFPKTRNIYVRWYQKWSKSWKWPSDQQKLLKFKGDGVGGVFKLSFGQNYINLVKKTPPPKAILTQTYVYSDWNKSESLYRKGDSIPNNSNFKLDTNRWYCIETMIKSSPLKDSKGEFAYWVNGDLKLHLKNTFNFVEGSKSAHPKYSDSRGYYAIEMQHVMQQTGGKHITVDMPTWMDNIVVSDQKIGCSKVPKQQNTFIPLPLAPTLSLQ